ncbi:MAG: DUF1828 domain-containing protein [Rhodospirillaceae bacterium]|nr:DUF1828 domain-containing protein [Rhodospirillaceae bacterium]
MINYHGVKKFLCDTFCSSIEIHPVPSGFAISTWFSDRSGDPIGCFLTEESDGYRVEDDGEYLARLIATGVQVDQGQRAQILDAILEQGDATWDRDTFEIRSDVFPETEVGARLIKFLSTLIRVRDLELLTRDVVRSTFHDDVLSALERRYSHSMDFCENQPVDETLAEFPPDLVIRHKHVEGAAIGALYFVTSNDKLNEALLLQMEADRLNRQDLRIIALIEDSDMRTISKKKFQRAQNRSLSMPIFRGDEDAAIRRIGRDLAIAGSHA